MKKVLVVHNPTAGDAELSKKELLSILEQNEWKISYVSTDDEQWQNFSLKEKDLIVLCGGDGTVHKLARELLKRKKNERQIPIYLIPAGTANNIANTLNLKSPRNFNFQENLKNYQLFDYGKISGLEDQEFFLEGIGFGFFPELIRRMKATDEIPGESGNEKLQRTLKVCRDIVEEMEPQEIEIHTDEESFIGSYLLAEVLNTKHIGPGLKLAPQANPGDGYMDLILISPEDRKLLLAYIDTMLNGNKEDIEVQHFVKLIKVEQVNMKSSTAFMHVDDSFLALNEKYNFDLKVKKGEFKFL